MKNSFSRKDNHRKSLMRNLVTSLILYEEIKTTKPKAKELKALVEHLIAKSKKNNLSAKRELRKVVFDEKANLKMFENIIPRYKNIQSGFIKTYKVGSRLGDGAEIVILKMTPGEEPKVEQKEKVKNDEQQPEKSKPKERNTKAKTK